MTIKDIAERCGVSVSTVSRVLNNYPDVSDDMRDRILSTIQEMHYVPNISARDLSRSRSAAIGVVVRGVGNPFFTGVIHAMGEAIERAGYTMVLHQIRSGEDEVRAGAELSRSRRLRGLILLGGCFDYGPEHTAQLNTPFVCCTYANSFGTMPREDFSSVSIDDTGAAREAVELLLRHGHRRIAILLDARENHSISQLRYIGYCRALEAMGISPEPGLAVEVGSFDMAAAYAGMQRLVSDGPEFTAVFAVADTLALAAIKALHDGGRRVPEDCSVVAIDGIDLSAYSIPTLTTMIQPQRQLGEQAVEILLDIIEGRAGNRQVILPTTLRPGGSIGRI